LLLKISSTWFIIIHVLLQYHMHNKHRMTLQNLPSIIVNSMIWLRDDNTFSCPTPVLSVSRFFLTIKVSSFNNGVVSLKYDSSLIINSSFYSFQLLQKNNYKYGSNNRCVNNSASNVWKLLTYCLMRYFIFPHLRPPQTIKLSTVELGQWVSNYQYGWILLQRIRYLKCIIVLIYH
jgi:hypothetical protein